MQWGDQIIILDKCFSKTTLETDCNVWYEEMWRPRITHELLFIPTFPRAQKLRGRNEAPLSLKKTLID